MSWIKAETCPLSFSSAVKGCHMLGKSQKDVEQLVSQGAADTKAVGICSEGAALMHRQSVTLMRF